MKNVAKIEIVLHDPYSNALCPPPRILIMVNSVREATTNCEVIVLDPPLLFKKKMNTSAMILVPQLSRECVGSSHSSPVESQYQKKGKNSAFALAETLTL